VVVKVECGEGGLLSSDLVGNRVVLADGVELEAGGITFRMKGRGMEPAIHDGDFLAVVNVEIKDLLPGEICVWRAKPTSSFRVGRVKQIQAKSQLIRTIAEHSTKEDLVDAASIVGRVVLVATRYLSPEPTDADSGNVG